jgi:hypothetical protein
MKTTPTVPHSATTPQPNALYTSRLPRRNERLRPQAPEQNSQAKAHFDAEGQGNWKMFLANTIVGPSSITENEKILRSTDKMSRLPQLKDRYDHLPASGQDQEEGQGRFGLGFSFGDHGAKLRGIFTDSTDRIVVDDSESRIYEQGPDTDASRELKLSNVAGSSVGTASDWGSQELQTDNDSLRRRSFGEEPPDIHRKRREALLGIVQELDSRQDLKSRLSRNSSVFDGGKYNGQPALAISCSDYFDTVGPVDVGSPSHANQFGSQYQPEDMYQAGRRNSSDRRRDAASKSPLPTFKISTDDGEYRQVTGRSRPHIPDRERPPRSAVGSPQTGRADSHQNTRDGSAILNNKFQPRSPVKRNGAETPSTRPVFNGSQQAPSPVLQEERYDHRRDFGRQSNIPQQATTRQNHELTSVSTAAESSYAAATRHREAFGIPRPISDYYSDSLHEVPSSQELAHADSDLSSVGNNLWREDCEGFSAEAQTLFEKLGGVGRHEENIRDRRSNTKNHQVQLRVNPRDFTGQRPISSLSQNSDASSMYDEHEHVPETLKHEQDQAPTPANDKESWRLSLPPPVYHSLLEQHGEVEMQRQEVIWELCRTEDIFVNHLHSVVRLFVQPLRAQNRKSWIAGVPVDVARLFDWLEDIVNLHSQILAALHGSRKGHYSAVERVAESLKAFVPRLEVYQPYLVRLEDIAALIERLMEEERSDFGQFVTLQENAKECDGWGLERFLIEPVNRLAQYPEFFRVSV